MNLHGAGFIRSAKANLDRLYRPTCSRRGIVCGEWEIPPTTPSVGDIRFLPLDWVWAIWTGEAWLISAPPEL